MMLLTVANRDNWSVDFNQFYVAGSLAGTGHLYDWNTVRALELQRTNATPFIRLPVFAVAMKAFSALPYSLARVLFLCLEIAALLGFIALWPFSKRTFAFAAVCWSVPVAMCLAFGQDSVLFLFFAALGLWLLLRGEDFWAGLALSMCAAKPHLALLIPVVLVAKSRYRSLLGGVTGGVVLVVASFASEGPLWPNNYWALTSLPDFDPGPDRMPNLRGLLTFLGGSLSLEAALATGVIATVWFLSRRVPMKSAMALALAGGLQVGHHAFAYDALLLLPALLLTFEEPFPEWLRLWAFVLLTPIPYVLLLTNIGFLGHLIVTGYTLALLLAAVRLTNEYKSLDVAV